MKNVNLKSKSKIYIWLLSILIISLSILLIIFYALYIWNINTIQLEWINYIFVALILLSFFSLGLIITKQIYAYNHYKNITRFSFDQYLDEVNSYSLVGSIIVDINNKILWTSKFINIRFGDKWTGKSVNDFFNHFRIKHQNEKTIEFRHDNNYYQVNFWNLSNSFLIKDITMEKNIMKLYENRSVVVGELEIDNYQLYQSFFSEEQLFNLNKEVINILDILSSKYNLFYRQYNTNGKFLIITDFASLEKMKKENFEFFDSLHNFHNTNESEKKYIYSVSAGFASGIIDLGLKMNKAKSALLLAQNRGGDQICILHDNENANYFGSAKEILPSFDRIRIKSILEVLKNKLLSKNIENVIIYGHSNADLDAIGSALGIATIVKYYNKKVFICTSTQDFTTRKIMNEYFEDNNIFIKSKQADKLSNEKTLVFFVDNAHPSRTDNPEALKKIDKNNIFILDHHRLNNNLDFVPKTQKIIDPSASSTSEIVTEILMLHKNIIPIDFKIAQMLLNGIYLDTLQFQKHVTSKTFEAASWLQGKGANATISSETLKMNYETNQKVKELLENLKEIKPGYYLSYKDVSVSNDTISIAAEEILRISNRKASFVIARNEINNKLKLSARGIDTNVQIIAEKVGGGGHFGTAAAETSEDMETFIDNIIQAIISAK
ncbi:DHH family phosphoesterase [Mycoplasma sp. 1018B]|uniref:DHH family phosphoesterase n=1 Tax=Mycoplasma sp. 1018B TaxID=2967302 RepID=UPI00211BAADC|nr:DHH family phosphoesterase [Mycoplasma sp. 1018B]UUM19055.1 DHH family phosphoesterase [Mycoplasma sp. 1018B]